MPEPTATECWTSPGQVAVRLRAYDAPDGAPVAAVVLHGLVTSVDGLRSARRDLDPYGRLAAEGLHVAAVDWPGHGRSGGRRGALSYRAAMDAAAAAVSTAAARWAVPVALVGVGLGGTLALLAAVEDRRVAAVAAHGAVDLRDVTAVPIRLGSRRAAPLAALARRALPSWPAHRMRVSARALLSPADLSSDPATARRLWRHPQAVRTYPLEPLGGLLLHPADKPDLAAVRVPVLLAGGTEDRVQPPAAARQVAARLACPHEMWTLPGGGHQLLVDHSAATVPVIAAFLRRHGC